ncbi:GumC family protein [Flavitalea sp.]|nr:polysaccharide biosynthesis tyrosine autokinase [Flavitalea sp.]
MQENKYISAKTGKKENNSIKLLLNQYLPYWPLFVLLVLICWIAAYGYLYVTKPIYEVSASILIKDEKKGADAERISDAINGYGLTKIVENEIEVVRSKDLLRKVIDSLCLYAPVFEDGTIIERSAYKSSPVIIEILETENIQKIPRVDFSYDGKIQEVIIGDKNYALNKWIPAPFGIVRFVENPDFVAHAKYPLFFSLVPVNNVLNNVSSKLNVAPAGKMSSVLYLTYRDAVPERGKDILNLLIDIYNQEAINDKNQIAANTLAFVENRMTHVVRELDSVEDQLQRFRTEKAVVNLSEQGKLYLQSVGENDEKLMDMDMQLSMLDEAEKYVRSKNTQIGIVPAITGVKDVLLSQLLQKLFDSQVQYERLKKTVPAGHPTMISLENEIQNLRPHILENIQNQRASIVAGRSQLSKSAGVYTSMLRSIPKNERGLLDISRQQTIKNNVYSFLLQKREEVALTYASSIADSRTIERAYASPGPVSPNKKFVIGVATAVALLIGVIIVNIKEILTNKILFRSDIEAITDIPVIAEIMRVNRKTSHFISNTSRSNLNEQFCQLRVALTLNNRFSQSKKILVTSGIPSEGKTFVSINLALSVAFSGGKVALVDMDLRSPQVSATYGLEKERGVANFLQNKEVSFDEIVYETDYPNLFIIPAGVGEVNPTELFLNGNIERLFENLNKTFDFIIVDASPIDPLADAYLLTEHCDSTLFIVRHDYTPKAMVELVQESRKVNALKNIAIVFNDIKPRGFIRKGYGYSYGYGVKKVYGNKVYGRSISARD